MAKSFNRRYNAVGCGQPPVVQIEDNRLFNRLKVDADAGADVTEAGTDVFRGGIEEAATGVVPAPDILAKSACNPVMLPTSTSVTFPLENSTDVALTASVMSPSRITVPLLASSRSGGRKDEVVAAHCLTSPSCDDATFHGHVWSAAPGNGGCRYTEISMEVGREAVAVSLLMKANDEEKPLRFRRPRTGLVTAVPPTAAAMGLATHERMRVSATLRSMSHEVTCLALDDIPIAQFPAVLMIGPVLGSSTTFPSRTSSYSRVSHPPIPGFPSFASHSYSTLTGSGVWGPN